MEKHVNTTKRQFDNLSQNVHKIPRKIRWQGLTKARKHAILNTCGFQNYVQRYLKTKT